MPFTIITLTLGNVFHTWINKNNIKLNKNNIRIKKGGGKEAKLGISNTISI
jgi:hypothetical protein